MLVRTRRRGGAAAAGVLVCVLVPAVAQADPAAVAATCFGQPATIVDQTDGANVVGTSHRDVIVASGVLSQVHARGGDDLICSVGDVWGNAGDDRISMRGPSVDPFQISVYGGRGSDEIHRDEPRHADPHFYLPSHGGPGNDRLFGGLNADELHGGPGADRVFGGAFYDRQFGNSGADLLSGGRRSDYLYGGSGPDQIHGEVGQDSTYGGDGDDFILGGSNDDLARGNRGDDRIYGQEGIDRAVGGDGEDICRSETMRDCEGGA